MYFLGNALCEPNFHHDIAYIGPSVNPSHACRLQLSLRGCMDAAGDRCANESVEDATSQVKIKEAFGTPENLQNCVGFLRLYASDRKAKASCAVVPAEQIAYSQVC